METRGYMDRRVGAGALELPAWPSMARPGARARSGEGVSESAFFRGGSQGRDVGL